MMFKLNRRSVLKTSAASMAAGAFPTFSHAQEAFTPPSYTPADLKGQLTPFGAIKAGNADGTIPAWTGGGYPMPEGYQPGDPRPIPFADEQPLFTITSANMAKYADKLSAGSQELFQKYPDFTMQVFPTHRTAIAPQYVYDNIYQNATNAQLSSDGNSVSGAYGGIPFPIPQNGHEVVWNHLLTWVGTTVYYVGEGHTVTASGEIVFESRSSNWLQYPYYIENGQSNWGGLYRQALTVPMAPPYEAGGSILQLAPVDLEKINVEAWTYLVGQRRVRRAPELQFDTPNSLSGGTTNWDEANIFQGKQIEYDFAYVGFKEMYVPYNTNKFDAASVDQQFLPHFLNPDLVRWELHRCRVVEMTLKAGSRNVDAKRILYCDEDTGGAVVGEVYDSQGALWKHQHSIPAVYGDIPCVTTNQAPFITYDLHAGTYNGGNHFSADCSPQWKPIAQLSDSFFTPGRLAGSGLGY